MDNLFGTFQLCAHTESLVISRCGRSSTAAVALTFQEHSSTCPSWALHYHHLQMMHWDTEIKRGIFAWVCRQGLSLCTQQRGREVPPEGNLGIATWGCLLWITFWKRFSPSWSLYLLNLRGPAPGCSCCVAEVLQADEFPSLPNPSETVIPATSSD